MRFKPIKKLILFQKVRTKRKSHESNTIFFSSQQKINKKTVQLKAIKLEEVSKAK